MATVFERFEALHGEITATGNRLSTMDLKKRRKLGMSATKLTKVVGGIGQVETLRVMLYQPTDTVMLAEATTRLDADTSTPLGIAAFKDGMVRAVLGLKKPMNPNPDFFCRLSKPDEDLTLTNVGPLESAQISQNKEIDGLPEDEREMVDAVTHMIERRISAVREVLGGAPRDEVFTQDLLQTIQ